MCVCVCVCARMCTGTLCITASDVIKKKQRICVTERARIYKASKICRKSFLWAAASNKKKQNTMFACIRKKQYLLIRQKQHMKKEYNRLHGQKKGKKRKNTTWIHVPEKLYKYVYGKNVCYYGIVQVIRESWRWDLLVSEHIGPTHTHTHT